MGRGTKLMDKKSILEINELEVNGILNRVFKVLLVILLACYGLQIVKSGLPMFDLWNFLFYSQWIFLIIPCAYYKFSETKKSYKYVALICYSMAGIFMYMCSWIFSSYSWIIGIAVASMYSDYKLARSVFIINIPLMIICNMANHFMYPTFNFQNTLGNSIIFSVYLLLQLLAVGLLFIAGIKRANRMLHNSEELTQNVSKILDTSVDSSEKLSEAVDTLYNNVNQANSALEQVSVSIQSIANETQNSLGNICSTDDAVEYIYKFITKTHDKTKEISTSTEKMSVLSTENKNKLLMAVNNMSNIERSTEESTAAVAKLEERAEDIEKAVSIINDIASQTNLLSLNAAIEAARAGESGKGFAVVAEEVQKLSAKSTESSSNIYKVIEGMKKDMEFATNAIKNTNRIVNENITSVVKTAKDYDLMYDMQQDILKQLGAVMELMSNLESQGKNIKIHMDDLKNVNEQHHFHVTDISSVVEELNATLVEITEYVGNINIKAKELAALNG